MSEHTDIEWTNATWNPITGCSIMSPGCTNCYAMKLAGTRMKHHPSRKGLTRDSKAGPVWNGEVRLNEGWLTQPLEWKRPRMIFVCAHGDLFHENVPDEWIDRVFAVMALCPQHTFQVLTKRAARMCAYVAERHPRNEVELAAERIKPSKGLPVSPKWCFAWPLPNVWLGVSCEDQVRADERLPHLINTPAAVRFLSAEPLLGPLLLQHDELIDGKVRNWLGAGGLDWVIVGGESGPRPMHPNWVRSLLDQCQSAYVPFFFKQWGEWAPAPWKLERLPSETDDDYKSRSEAIAATHGFAPWGQLNLLDHRPWSIERVLPEPHPHVGMRRAGKRAAGRLFDGRTWDEMPEIGQRPQCHAGSDPVGGFDTSTTRTPYQSALMKVTP